MSFFDAKPPEPEPEYAYEPDPRDGPPRGVVGGVVGERMLLARTAETLVVLHDVEAYPTGVSLRVAVRGSSSDSRNGMSFHAITTPEWHAGVLAPAFFRFGVELADGRRATNLDRARRLPSGASAGSRLSAMGASGNGESVDLRFWLWPLPILGRVTFACEWPLGSIAEHRAALDTAAIVLAAERARPYLAGNR